MLGYIEVTSNAIELGHVGAKCFGDLKAAMLSAALPASVGRNCNGDPMTAPYADLIERLRRNTSPNDPEAAKAIEALQADNDRLQAEVTRLLTAFDGLTPGD